MTTMQNWILGLLAFGQFKSKQDVLHRAVIVALRIALLAYGLNVVSHLFLAGTGLLPYGLLPALAIATVLTPFVTLIVAFWAYYMVGLAIYDLTISHAEFERISRTDSLCGLLNRRAFLDMHRTAANPAALLVFDVDRFKSVNDRYGHSAGDAVIRMVAETIAAVFSRPGDVVARFGGEEFTVLASMVEGCDVFALATQTRQEIEARVIDFEQSRIAVTISAGIADCGDHEDFQSLFSAADRALYLAKVTGRNRVVHANDPPDMTRINGALPEILSAIPGSAMVIEGVEDRAGA